MYLTKNMKIYGSILLAIVIVGMPLYQMTFAVSGSNDKYDALLPEYDVNDPLPINQPPVCVMDFGTVIQMTTGTTFYLGQNIDMCQYFEDVDTADLDYSVVFWDTVANVTFNDHYLESVTTYDEPGNSYFTVVASDGWSQASYDFTLSVNNRETISLNEDIPGTIDVSQYVPFTPEECTIECIGDISAELEYNYFLYVNMSIAPFENWWGDGMVTLSLYDAPHIYPIPPNPPYDERNVLAAVAVYTYGYFEFDVDVYPVNDPPEVINEQTYQFLITEDTSADLISPIELSAFFMDVDSELQYSWMSQNGMTSLGIMENAIKSVSSIGPTGYDDLTIIAQDGEYFATFGIPVSILPRTGIDMEEDMSAILDIGQYVNDPQLEFLFSGADNVATEVPPDAYSDSNVILTPSQNWFGTEVISLTTYPMMHSINPPVSQPIISSVPIQPIIPPQPAADNLYGFYEFDVGVAAVNDPPYALTTPTITMSEDEILNDAFNIRDYFGDVDSVLEYAIDDSSASFVIADAGLGGNVDISALSNWFGIETFTITATDGEYEASGEISVRVLPVNDIPFATDADASLTLAEDTNIAVHLDEMISDVDSALWFSYSCDDANSTVELNDATWEMNIVPDANWNGMIDMVIYGSDGEYELARNLTLNVTAVNDQPEIISTINITMTEDVGLDLDLSTYITDVDSELEFIVYSCRGRLRCERGQGPMWTLSTSQGHWNGNETLSVIAYDGEYMLTLDLNVEVLAVNNAPTQNRQMSRAMMEEDSTFTLGVDNLFTDVDEDVLAYTFDSGDPLQLEYNEESMMLAITPYENWYGDSTVSIQAYDGALWTTIEIQVNVASVNDPPYLVSGVPAIVLAAGNSTNISLSGLFNDVDSYVLTIEVLGIENLEVTPMDAGVFNIRSLDSWEGSQTLLVRVSDGEDVTETTMTVSTYIPDVTTEAAVSGGGFVDNVYWMMFGMALAVVIFVAYTATETRKMNSASAARKGRIL